VRLDPGAGRVRIRLALALTMLHRFEAALEALEDVDLAGRPLAEAHYLRGLSRQSLGDLVVAEAELAAALALCPGHSPAFRKLSQLYDEQDRRAALRRLCEDLLSKGVRHSRLLMQWGGELARAGDAAARRVLLDPGRVGRTALAPPPGFASLQDFNRALADELMANPHATEGYAEDPVYRGGQRVHHLLHGRRPDLVRAFHEAARQHVVAWLDSLAPYAGDDLWLQARPRRAGIASWGIIQSEGHHLDWHIHPNAWVSVVYYVDVPDMVTTAGDGPGCIEFGAPPEVATLAGIPTLRLAPRSGELLITPAHYHHRSIPTGAAARRISIPFDVIPASTGPAAWPAAGEP
jgi:hypothetical protein